MIIENFSNKNYFKLPIIVNPKPITIRNLDSEKVPFFSRVNKKSNTHDELYEGDFQILNGN